MSKVWRSIPAIGLLVLGLVLLVMSFFFAVHAFLSFGGLPTPSDESLARALVKASYDLINLAARLAFLGIGVWVGSIVLRNGVELMKGERRGKESD
ncbi:MAG: hypothetical protein QXK12_02075 [Candidatus Nezhaarchaeales archaeon]